MILLKADDIVLARAKRVGRSLTLMTVLLSSTCLLFAASAHATFEQVGIFAGQTEPYSGPPFEYPEEVQLGGVGGMDVNSSGVGGVAPGTLYASIYQSLNGDNNGPSVARFDSHGKFLGTWRTSDGKRCGPEPEAVQCPPATRHVAAGDVVVDPATGHVFALNSANVDGAGALLISEWSADGSELIARFGEEAVAGETTVASPGKIHSARFGGLATGAAGTLYAIDINEGQSPMTYRVMTFKPETPGDYQHYVYGGQAGDIGVSFGTSISTGQNGRLFEAAGDHIYEFNLEHPVTPVCEFKRPGGGITAITASTVTGRVFFYNEIDGKLHELEPCNAQGKLIEPPGSSFVASPKRSEITALAFNPGSSWGSGRPPGALYAADPEGSGGLAGNPEVSGPALGYIFAQPPTFPPKVVSESVANVGSVSANLEASINPSGFATNYTFQYLTAAAYEANEPADRFAGAIEAPLGGALLGSGTTALPASVSVSGLAADTEYRYRVIATNAQGEDVGSAHSFHTFPLVEAPGLSDGRAYELISPTEKNGGEVYPANPQKASCGRECKPGVTSEAFPMQSTADGEAVVYEGDPFSPSEGPVRDNQYIARRTASGWQTTLLSPIRQGGGEEQGFKAFDSGLTRTLLSQRAPSLSPEAPGEYSNLYTQSTTAPSVFDPLLSAEAPNRPATGPEGLRLSYAGSSDDLSRVFFEANDALTGETPFAPEAIDGGAKKKNLYEWAEGGLRLVNVAPGNVATAPGASLGAGNANAISGDGSRVYWSDEAGQLYVRENAEATKEIPDPGKFLAASTDGSKVLLENGHLYDLQTEAITDLTEGKGGFEGILGQSDDLSHLYFADTEVLDETPNAQGNSAEAGKSNIYAWDGGANTYVATLLPVDIKSSWARLASLRTAEASPDGRWLAFLAETSLTGYDNVGACLYDPSQQKNVNSAPCQEVFLYDSATSTLTCTSCSPSGAQPLGESSLPRIGRAFGSTSLPQPRYLTNQGRLYFDSADSLVLADTNEGVEDVYQYEPDGIGSCTREGGCVALISAGREDVDSNFLAIDGTAKNVFFTSRDQLVLKDHDELIDLYVAREGGGSPSETEISRGECQGEACQPLVAAPNDPTPASASFEGAGNIEAKKTTAKKSKKKAHKKPHAKKRHTKRAKHDHGGAK
jgi:hypothetical protein